MAVWSEMGGGARATAVALGVAGVIVLGYGLVGRKTQDVDVALPIASSAPGVNPAPDSGVVASTQAAPEGAAAGDARTETPAEPAVAQKAAPIAPSFDNWRVEAGGAAVVAGRAEPGSVVTVLVDGTPVADAAASPRGEFVALFTLLPNENPSLMTLEATLPDGTKLVAAQSVALAAIAGPQVAAAPEGQGETKPLAARDADPVEGMTAASVEEPAAPQAVLITEEGVSVLQAPAPEKGAQGAVSIDVIAYTASGDVQLSGKGHAGEFVRIYLDNAPVATTSVASGGQWTVTLTDTPPGIYTLRADQVDGSGQVTARFETPFKRETREALAAIAAPETAPTPAPEPEPTPAPAPTPAPEPEPELKEEVALAPEASEAAPVASDAAAPSDLAAVQSEPVAETPADSIGGDVATDVASAQTELPAEQTAADAPADTSIARAAATPAQPPVAPSDQAPVASPTVAIAADANAPAASAAITPAAAKPALAEPVAEGAAPVSPPSVSITVQPGYTLWGIARQQLGDGILYVQVFEANQDKIRNPDLIYPGQVFVLPTR